MTARRTQTDWLADILDAVDAIRAAEAVLSDDDPAVTAVVLDAVTYRVMTIGEAAKNLRDDVREVQPQIPWKAVAGMRDVIAHHYHRRDLRIIRATVDEHLEPLQTACRALIGRFEQDGETLRTARPIG